MTEYFIIVLKIPPPTKYDPRLANLKTHLIKDGLGVLRAERDYSYILKKNIPGPGGYDLMNDKLTSPNRFVQGKIIPEPKHASTNPKNDLPGPGYYDLVKPIVKEHSWDMIRSKADHYRELRRPNFFQK